MLLDAKRRGVSFDSVATLGHLKWYVRPAELLRAGAVHGVDVSAVRDLLPYRAYSDAFFHDILGAKTLTAIDHSAYQGARVVHDMNLPIPRTLEESFDVVVDSGTLEHVFNFPTALANCMKMLKVGGTLFISIPANNYLGHGFYQFSPELFFRVFQKENGFEMVNLYLLKHPYSGSELSTRQKLYRVTDPNDVRQRVMLVDGTPALMLVEARRVSRAPIFAAYPQQSDYAKIWGDFDARENAGEKTGGKKNTRKNVKERVKKMLALMPMPIQNFFWGRYQRFLYSYQNKNFYTKVKK
jgi:SAM-dependent methyltransferase